MVSQFAPWIETESSSQVTNPPPSVQPARNPTTIELDELTFGKQYNGPETPASGTQTPKTPAEVESNSLSQAVPVMQSLTNPPQNRLRLGAACLIFIQMGLNDSAPGALLPYLEAYYNVSYGIVSLVFVANAVGFVSAAFITNHLHARFGRAIVMAMGMLCTVVGYVMLVCTPPYPLVVVSFFFSGIGNALCLSLVNGWLAGLVNATVLLGICHAAYGVGGILGPLIATVIVGSGRKWSVFYTLSLALSVANSISAYLTFRDVEKESVTTDPLVSALEREISKTTTFSPLKTKHKKKTSSAPRTQPRASLRSALTSRVVLLGAWFIFAYQGAEVTISGWVLSFLLTTRPHPASQSISLGYITSGFWGGITVGRLVLTHPAQRIGEKTSVFALLGAATAVQFIVWFVPSIVAEAVAVAIVGLLLGPIYPCATVVFSRLMTKDELVPALSIVTALGSSGGAAGPFITGVIGQKVGAWVLNPIVVVLNIGMVACWIGLPRISKRKE